MRKAGVRSPQRSCLSRRGGRGGASSGTAGRGMVVVEWSGKARKGSAVMASQGKPRNGMPGRSWQGLDRTGTDGPGAAVEEGRGTERKGRTCHGGRGKAGSGSVPKGRVGKGMAVRDWPVAHRPGSAWTGPAVCGAERVTPFCASLLPLDRPVAVGAGGTSSAGSNTDRRCPGRGGAVRRGRSRWPARAASGRGRRAQWRHGLQLGTTLGRTSRGFPSRPDDRKACRHAGLSRNSRRSSRPGRPVPPSTSRAPAAGHQEPGPLPDIARSPPLPPPLVERTLYSKEVGSNA